MNQEDSHDLEHLTHGVLIKRADLRLFPGANSQLAPRQYVYMEADVNALIDACSRRLEQQPSNVRALMIRANSYLKKGKAI